MQYRLVLKENNNNYQPFDYNMLDTYHNQKMETLEGIDDFTSQYDDEVALKFDLYKANFIDIDEAINEMKIIFYENNGNREYKYGILYKDAREFVSGIKIYEFLHTHLNDVQAMNKIFNEFNKRKEKSTFLNAVLDVLRNVRKSENVNNVYYVNFLPYEEKRSLGMYIYHTFYDIIYTEHKESDSYEIKRTRNREEKKAS